MLGVSFSQHLGHVITGWLSINRRAVELSNLRQLQIVSFGVREQNVHVST